MLTQDKLILSWIRGYKIPFKSQPVQLHKPPAQKWSDRETKYLKLEIDKLLKKGAIKKCNSKKGQFLSSIFLVPKPNGTFRLILNLKKLNEFIETEHFKLEDLKTVTQIMNKDDFFISIDLTDAFHLVNIHESDRKFLRFEFLGQIYEFVCVPFGLCTAPYMFTKLLKPVISYLRLLGLVLVIYLDDFLILSKLYNTCLNERDLIIYILENLGFIINREKSQLIPTQRTKYLGLIIDSQKMCFELPEDKKQLIYNQITSIQAKNQCKIRDFAEFLGRLTFATNGIQYSQVYTKKFEREKFLALERNGNDFEAKMPITKSLYDDFEWWKSHIFTSRNPIKNFDYKLEIFSDASLSGWGAHCARNGVVEKTHGFWNACERNLHINFLELTAAFFGLICFAKDLRDCDILLRIDNTTAISYINRMGGIQFPKLNEIARDIWKWCEDRRIWVFASYIKSKDNNLADSESRILEPESEFGISESAFAEILDSFGNPEIDLFASRLNNKCKKFVSWHRDPLAFEIDAFTIKWNTYFFYAFPPFSLILKVLRKIIRDKGTGIVVVPYWPAQPWFPIFTKLLSEKPLFFHPNNELLLSSNRKPHPLWRQLTLVAGKLSGSHML